MKMEYGFGWDGRGCESWTFIYVNISSIPTNYDAHNITIYHDTPYFLAYIEFWCSYPVWENKTQQQQLIGTKRQWNKLYNSNKYWRRRVLDIDKIQVEPITTTTKIPTTIQPLRSIPIHKICIDANADSFFVQQMLLMRSVLNCINSIESIVIVQYV